MIEFENYLLIIPIISFLVLLIMHLWKRYKDVFDPIYFYTFKFENTSSQKPFNFVLLEDKLKINYDNAKYSKKELKIRNIENILMLRQIVLLFDKNITSILESKAYYKEIIFKALYSMVFAMFVLGSINYCIFKFNNDFYEITDSDNTFFNFLL
ncbi:MAG: hypothetical protein IPP42_02820 [Saprospiraceae bacterium]|nr:hypothetical protein [Saprospiraceae bacterium]